MENQQNFGLIGRNISYSFSKKYFTEKFRKLFLKNHFYDIFDLQNLSELDELIEKNSLRGFNVTIPFKQSILPYLDELSDEAANIGAVNTVKISDGKKIGYNTDAFGFEKTLQLHRKPQHSSALILGNGGAAAAVRYVLGKQNIPFETISRATEKNYENLQPDSVSANKIIIQCTPVGTFPETECCVDFPFSAITPDHLAIDLIYNPDTTLFLKNCRENGAKTVNGYYMLEQQAEKAWEIWNSEKNTLI